ncbi:MAG: alpha/beta hydrolase [Polaribacter sp.]|nr:alpha/beta hydrolase [Polaribacter sp.]
MILPFKGTNIYFETHGKGAAIVLLHGFLENSTMWKDLIAELSKRNKVIAIDLLGHGNSDCLGYIHTMELFAETVAAVLKQLKIRKCSLVGHSLGGYVALAFAEKNPEKVTRLCLMNSTSNEDSEERKDIRTRANKMAQTNLKNMIQLSISNLFYQENVSKFTSEIDFLKKEALKTSLQGYLAAQEGMKIRRNRNHILTNATFKKLLIIGEKDPVIDVNSSLDEAQKTNTEFIIFDGGHMSYVENTKKLLDALLSFLK